MTDYFHWALFITYNFLLVAVFRTNPTISKE